MDREIMASACRIVDQFPISTGTQTAAEEAVSDQVPERLPKQLDIAEDPA